MKSEVLTCITTITLCATLTISVRVSAQEQQVQKKEHTGYRLIDLGTFGGATSTISPYHKQSGKRPETKLSEVQVNTRHVPPAAPVR
ncbi:MAG TPA: hypothetical protein VK335_03425 [Bryobacteraceae bacterium]|nr:hypothetical protein [Bryobacteraceae bacterium]